MGYLNVIVAGIAGFGFGAVWYMALAKPWMAATGVTEEQQKNGGPMPFVIGLIGAILCAGMMRHIFASTGVDTVGKGFTSGLGIGAFIVVPWLATNYAFAQRPKALTLIDGGYAIGGCTAIGIVLMLF